MALGYDTTCAKLAIDLKITFTAAIPFDGQEQKWPKESQDEYNSLLDKAFYKVIVSEGTYAAWKMHARNVYIVENCDLLIAAFNGEEQGGTWNCIQYAKNVGGEIRIIDVSEENIARIKNA